MSSETEICNLALSLLGQKSITNLTTPTTQVEQLCALQYPLMRDAVLEECEWSFAVRRYVDSSPASSAPEWGYQYQYLLDTNILRVTFCSDNSNERYYNSGFHWVKEDNYIRCDASTIYYRTINRVTETSKFSSLFIQALAARLAMEMCLTITESKTLLKNLTETYNSKKQKAETINNMQGKSQRLRTGQLNAARGGV